MIFSPIAKIACAVALCASIVATLATWGYLGTRDKLVELQTQYKQLEQANKDLDDKLQKERKEVIRLNNVDNKTAKQEIVIETKYVEVEKEIIVYADSPASNRCTIDGKWVQLYDASLQISGMPKASDTGKVSTSSRGTETTITLSEEEYKQFSVRLSDALNVAAYNNKLHALLRVKYAGLYEACTGEVLK